MQGHERNVSDPASCVVLLLLCFRNLWNLRNLWMAFYLLTVRLEGQ
jgi:hypothetical protein